MVFNVRCFKCGEHRVRLVLGGRAIIHARCHGCESNLLAEVMEFEQKVMAAHRNEVAQVNNAEEIDADVDPENETASRSISTLTSNGVDDEKLDTVQAGSP